MPASTLTRPKSETTLSPSWNRDATPTEGERVDYRNVAAEYASQARRMYEARPQQSLVGLLRLMWDVIRTRTVPKSYKL
jgi:hypothetical protein